MTASAGHGARSGPMATPLDRLDFSAGDRIRSKDLGDLAGYEARLLALHVRGSHRTHGVARGLGLSLVSGNRAVAVSSGAAYTAYGEVIVLHRPVTIPAPRLPTPGISTVRFGLMLGTPVASEAAGDPTTLLCALEKPALAPPSLRWAALAPAAAVAADRYPRIPGAEVLLGTVVRRSDGTLNTPSIAERHMARRLARPHVAGGVLRMPAIEWHSSRYPLLAAVDTSAAGFLSTPAYFVSLVGGDHVERGLLGPLLSVEQSLPRGFALRLLMAGTRGTSVEEVRSVLTQSFARAEIHWTGYEGPCGCGEESVKLADGNFSIHDEWSGVFR